MPNGYSWQGLVVILKFFSSLILLVAGTIGLVATNANATDHIISEVRVGAGVGDFSYNGRTHYYEYDREEINAELLFVPLSLGDGENASNDIIRMLLTPRPHLGGTFSLQNDGTSSLYGGLTWHYAFTPRLFIESSFGAAVHNGELNSALIGPGLLRRGYGSTILFRESVAIGAELRENLNVILQFSHMSHAGLAGAENSGKSSIHLKLGWEF